MLFRNQHRKLQLLAGYDARSRGRDRSLLSVTNCASHDVRTQRGCIFDVDLRESSTISPEMQVDETLLSGFVLGFPREVTLQLEWNGNGPWPFDESVLD